MTEIRPPFTEHYAFTGPNVAISCDIEWDDVRECWHATSSAGFHGTGDTQDQAALACFEAWTTSRAGWFEAIDEGEADGDST